MINGFILKRALVLASLFTAYTPSLIAAPQKVLNSKAQHHKIHILKEGETISHLLKLYGHSPLYTKDGWVKKTLEMNHLTFDQAKKIKKGYPIILPKTEESSITQILNQARLIDISHSKIVSHTNIKKKNKFFGISSHQDALFKINIAQEDYQGLSESINNQDSYGLSFRINGKNNYSAVNLMYNYFGDIYIKSFGTGHDDKNNRAISLRPLIQSNLGVIAQNDYIPFHFGLTTSLEERSLILNNEQTRRDRNFLIGALFKKSYLLKHTNLHTHISYKKNIAQDNQPGRIRYEASYLETGVRTNITQNSLIGLEYTQIDFEKIKLEQNTSLGLNLTYLLE